MVKKKQLFIYEMLVVYLFIGDSVHQFYQQISCWHLTYQVSKGQKTRCIGWERYSVFFSGQKRNNMRLERINNTMIVSLKTETAEISLPLVIHSNISIDLIHIYFYILSSKMSLLSKHPNILIHLIFSYYVL